MFVVPIPRDEVSGDSSLYQDCMDRQDRGRRSGGIKSKDY